MSNTLIMSVSGVRGIVGTDLTPELVARHAAAFGILAQESGKDRVVLARDARTSGPMFAAAAVAGLQSVGMGVIDCGLIPTPTAQLAVEHHGAAGAIIITASHNPVEWNALKFAGPDGMFLEKAAAGRLFDLAAQDILQRSGWDQIGESESDSGAVARHIDCVLDMDISVPDIEARSFRVALDCVHGAGGTIMPQLLARLGCDVVGLGLETDGVFPRSPEPVPANLSGLGDLVRDAEADLGIAVDPDVDRLALVDENGAPIGEDYTLAFAVRCVLSRRTGPVVTNLSTSMVVDDAASEFGVQIERAPVGEANVAGVMKQRNAVIGGEGNGGVMYPDLHIGRDAPVAAALVLDLLARTGKSVSGLVGAQQQYVIVKAKAPRGADLGAVYADLEATLADGSVDRQDGMRLTWDDRWLHVRPSGTEPIVRLIAEARTEEIALDLVDTARRLLEAKNN
jgi:phosphomannomutase